MWLYVGLATLAVVIFVLVWWLDPNLRRGRKFAAGLKTRPPLSDAQMISRYLAEDDVPAEVPGRVRRVFAKFMAYPAEKLLPDDDLTFFWVDLDMIGLFQELESGFGITISPAEAERIPCTIRGVSLLVARRAGRTSSYT
jgi:hypothetical protein